MAEIRKRSFGSLTDDLLEFDEIFENQIDPETGEILEGEALEALRHQIEKEIARNVDGVVRFIKHKEGEIDIIKNEIDRMSKAKKVKENKIANLKNYLKMHLVIKGIKKVEGDFSTISLRDSKSTEIDENIIDKKYGAKIETYKFDKTEIKKLIEGGEEIDGARIVTNQSVQIK